MDILFIWTGPSDLIYADNQKNNLFNFVLSNISYSPRPTLFYLLKQLTPEKHSVDIVQAGRKSDINFNKKYDLVGITFVTRYAFLAYRIADEFRKRGIKVVLGGYHASALPKEAKEHADSVVIGEGEDNWPKLLNDLEKGELKQLYYQDKPIDLNKINFPKNVDEKGKDFAVYATRGCPNGCEFCAITNMRHGKKFRKRNIENVIEEIKAHKGKYFSFRDSSLTIDPTYTKELFIAMKEVDKKFYAMGNLNILAKDEELLKLSVEAGCTGWLIGFESVNQKSIDEICKKTNKVEDYYKAVKKIHDHGMMIDGTFVFGFDHDTLNIFEDTYNFVQNSEIDRFLSMILTPYPGTPLYSRLDKEGRILTKNWDKYNMEDVVFEPKNMTPEELYRESRELHDKIHTIRNSIPKIFRSIRYGYNPFKIVLMDNVFSKLIRY